MEKAMRNIVPLLALLALSGCVSIPELKWPKFDLPAASSPLPPGEGRGVREQRLDKWWSHYGDPTLDNLMTEALAHNADLRLAAARIDEARANLGLAEGARQPTVGASLGASRNQQSEANSFKPPISLSNKFQAGLQAAYELDWWGRYRSASEAARADLLASEMGREVVRNGLTTTVANAWFSLRALDAQLNLADQTLANRRTWLDLQKLRYRVGEASELELRQSEAELAAVESARTQLVRAQAEQANALAVLLGRSPRQQAEAQHARGETLPAIPEVPAGLPSDLLARRPDLRQAEAALTAADARIAEAKAAIFPSLTLTANLGSESKALSDLFSGPATVWGLAASLAQTLYNAGRTEAALQATLARREQALIGYEQSVRLAFRETLDALVANRQAREQAEAEARRVEAQRRATELAELRYKNGVASHLDVLDAQRNLYQAEQGRLDADLARLTASADLFKALGGGWRADKP
jgi:multidrug efflux system outer membrane protein